MTKFYRPTHWPLYSYLVRSDVSYRPWTFSPHDVMPPLELHKLEIGIGMSLVADTPTERATLVLQAKRGEILGGFVEIPDGGYLGRSDLDTIPVGHLLADLMTNITDIQMQNKELLNESVKVELILSERYASLLHVLLRNLENFDIPYAIRDDNYHVRLQGLSSDEFVPGTAKILDMEHSSLPQLMAALQQGLSSKPELGFAALLDIESVYSFHQSTLQHTR